MANSKPSVSTHANMKVAGLVMVLFDVVFTILFLWFYGGTITSRLLQLPFLYLLGVCLYVTVGVFILFTRLVVTEDETLLYQDVIVRKKILIEKIQSVEYNEIAGEIFLISQNKIGKTQVLKINSTIFSKDSLGKIFRKLQLLNPGITFDNYCSSLIAGVLNNQNK